MTESPRFCENCRGGLNQGARFCSACGAQVKGAPSAPSVPVAELVSPTTFLQPAALQQAAVPEPVVGVIAGLLRRKGLLGMGAEYWMLVVTPIRLIVAEVPNKTMQAAMLEANRDPTLIDWTGVIARRYATMPPSVALSQSSKNWAVPLNQVHEAGVRTVSEARGDDSDVDLEHLTIVTTGGRHDWILTGGNSRQARQILQSVFGSPGR